jgi:HK97 family phage major capsid protein
VVEIQPIPAGRMLTVYLLLCAALVGLAGRLAWLQVVQAPALQARARAIQTQAITPIGKRRTIVDRMGTRLLRDPYTNKPFVQFYATKRVGGDVIDSEAIKVIGTRT